MYCFAAHQPRVNTTLNGLLKNLLETFIAPTLAYLRKTAMVGQPLVETIAGEPTNCDINLRFTHEFAVMHDALEETSQHQTNRRFRIDAGPTVVATV